LLFGAGKFAHTGYKGVKSVIPGGKTAVTIFGERIYRYTIYKSLAVVVGIRILPRFRILRRKALI
jgi:hypothetical protein